MQSLRNRLRLSYFYRLVCLEKKHPKHSEFKVRGQDKLRL